jgi:two-component system OmpR family sensor kinase
LSVEEFQRDQVAPPAEPAGPPPTSDEELIEAPPRKRRVWLRSLTSRLVVGVVALVVVLVAAIGTTTYVALQQFLTNRLDQQLDSTASSSFTKFIGSGGRAPLPGYQTPLNVWAVALTPAGTFLGYTAPPAPFDEMKLTAAQLKKLGAATPSSPTTLRTTDGHELRVETTDPVTVQLNGVYVQLVVAVGLSTEEENRTLGRLVAIELIIGGAAVLLAFAATSWGVRRSLRNLYTVTGTAQEVAAELSPEGAGLDRRVPVVEEGTEVGQLAESMNTLLSAVETQFAARLESEQRMRQFLADASHELRTPLTSIRGYAELARMQRVASGETQSTSADNLDRIESEGTRMSRLVDDLLLLARGDAEATFHPAEREPVHIADLLDDAVSGSRAAFPDRPIDVEIAPVPTVLGDRDQLLRVVRNLITNAAVHTEAGRPIRVHGFADAGGVVVTVADGGPGLPSDEAAHVFERFWRADKARTRARGGSGLGLSIVAAIVRAHGGSVRFDSSVESGSTVTLWLPAGSG